MILFQFIVPDSFSMILFLYIVPGGFLMNLFLWDDIVPMGCWMREGRLENLFL